MPEKDFCQILCLSGWGQKFDSLAAIFSESFFDPFFVSSFDYFAFDDFKKLCLAAKLEKPNTKILIGWSLGGQVAIRLVAEKVLAPELLILIAPPFQMVSGGLVSSGMPKTTFAEFCKKFSDAPSKTLKRFATLVSTNDCNISEILRSFSANNQNPSQLKFWLEELGRFSCLNVDFSNMPRTLIFQGEGDIITHISQVEFFKQKIKNLRLEIFKDCGHAPHLSDLARVRATIAEEVIRLSKSSEV